MTDDLISNLRIVLSNDPALDLRAMNLRAYLETRDPALVRVVPGMQPRWFEIRALDPFEVAAVKSAVSAAGMVIPAIQCGLVSVTGPGFDDGTATRPTRDKEAPDGRRVGVWDPKDIDALFKRLGWNRLLEVALVIIERADAGNVDGGGVRFTLPPLSQPVLAQSDRLRAEQTREESATRT